MEWATAQPFAGSTTRSSQAPIGIKCMTSLKSPSRTLSLGRDLLRRSGVRLHDAHKRSLNLTAGDPFVCAGYFSTQADGLWTGDHRATFLKRTMPVLDEAVESLRIFSGAFSGWGQALGSLPSFCPNFRLGTQTFVDVDVDVTNALARKHGCNVTPAPVQASAVVEVSLHKVVRAEVADPCLLHVVQPVANFIFTASPPCISWSRGGLGRGLNCLEGPLLTF